MEFFKHLSARRAWHDCFYIRTHGASKRFESIMKRAREDRHYVAGLEKQGGQQMLRVYVESEKEGRKKVSHCIPLMSSASSDSSGQARDFFLAWDPIWRGHVQAAIRRLDHKLRAFGMIMYAPTEQITEPDVEVVHSAVKSALYDRLEAETVLRWKSRKVIRVNFLIYAAMRHHRDLVFGGGPTLGGPAAINTYLYQNFGERIPSARKNWYRDWQPLWDVMLDCLNDLERDSLSPIAAVINQRAEAA